MALGRPRMARALSLHPPSYLRECTLAQIFGNSSENTLANGKALLASYPQADLSEFDGAVVSVVGSADGVMNRKSYEAARSKLPAQARELEIPGGNHANFGDYGDQSGDGTAAIPREDQQSQTADAIVALLTAQ